MLFVMRATSVHHRVWMFLCISPLAAAVMMTLCFIGGCQFKGGPGERGGALEDGAGEVWDIRPTGMRIYPSSEFRTIAGQTALEARIELFDDLMDSIKGVGTVRFELYPVVMPEQSDIGARLFAWEVPMLTRADNASRYDAVTRTYHFQLHLPQPPEPGKPLKLIARFDDARSGERLSDETVIQP